MIKCPICSGGLVFKNVKGQGVCPSCSFGYTFGDKKKAEGVNFNCIEQEVELKSGERGSIFYLPDHPKVQPIGVSEDELKREVFTRDYIYTMLAEASLEGQTGSEGSESTLG